MITAKIMQYLGIINLVKKVKTEYIGHCWKQLKMTQKNGKTCHTYGINIVKMTVLHNI